MVVVRRKYSFRCFLLFFFKMKKHEYIYVKGEEPKEKSVKLEEKGD